MTKIKPKKLNKGDTIGILAVSGKISEIKKIENAKKFFEKQGYNVIISKTCESSHRYMAGSSDEECVNTLHNFFEDRNIDAIFCARGGYGTLRLINKIDWNIIQNNPKIFAGYSDITILLAKILKETGLITFHSPMPNGDFGDKIQEYTQKRFFNTLTGDITEIKAENSTVYSNGEATGILWGGNLASLVSLCGTDFIPDEDIILFLEDLNEPVYKIDKMLTQLFNIDKAKQNIKGIAIGEFKDIGNKEQLNELLKELSEQLNIPMCDGFKITHDKIKDTIPYGVKAKLSIENGTIQILENYVQ